MQLLSASVAFILAGVWLILFGLGETSEVLDLAFGGYIAAVGIFGTGVLDRFRA